MFSIDDSQSLTLEELTWLSASALIENQHALSESPSPDRDSRALFNTVFSDSRSELDMKRGEDDEDSSSPSHPDSPSPHMSDLLPRPRAPGASSSGSPTPSMVGSSIPLSGPSGPSAPLTPSPSPLLSQSSSSLFLPGRHPITPPPTPPRRHLHPPRYLSPSSSSQLVNEPYGGHGGAFTPPSPSVSSSTLSSTLSSRQTEWIYRRPKVVNSSGLQGVNGTGGNISMGNTLLSRHRSTSINAGQCTSATASCSSRQVSRSPSIASSSYRTTTAATYDNPHNVTTTTSTSSAPPSNRSGSSSTSSTRRTSKLKHHAASGSLHATKPRPSSPTLISSTTQLVDVGSSPVSSVGVERSPSVCSNVTNRSHNNGRYGTNGSGGLVRSPTLNASVSSLQLQSSIRVSPLKNRHSRVRGGGVVGGGGGGGGDGSDLPMTNSGLDAITSVVAGNQVAEPQPPTTAALEPVGTHTVLERSLSNASTTTNRSVGKPIWSAFRSGHGGTTVKSSALASSSTATMGAAFATRNPERNRMLKLKSIPSQTQISIDSSVTPTFVTPPPAASSPLFIPSNLSPFNNNNVNPKDVSEKLSPRSPSRIRHSLSATSTTTTGASSLPRPQKDKDRSFQRREKFASAPPLPVSFVGVDTRSVTSKIALTSDVGDASSTSSPALPHSGVKMSPSLVLSPPSPPASRLAAENRSRRRRSSSSSNTNQNSSTRDRTSSFASQTSIATATTAQTSATTRTSSSCSTTSSLVNSPCIPITPTTTAPSSTPIPGDLASKPLPVLGAYNCRSLSNSADYTSPCYHLHGHDGEKKPPFLLNHHQPYQHRHQRQSSTSSSVSFNRGGNAAAASARSQAYAQLTGTTNVAGVGLGLGTIANVSTNISSRQRRPSTSPGSGSGSETSSIHSHIHLGPYGQRHRFGQGGGAAVSGGSANTLIPPSSSPPAHQHHARMANPSLVSLSHHGRPSAVARTPSQVTTPHVLSHHFSSLPKTKSILTRTSSLSTKASACGGTVKSVKFVEIPEVYYRSGYYEYDENEFVYGCDNGSADDEEDENEDDIPAVGAKGEGQEGMVLRECSGMDIEAIDMDIDTYLGTHRPLVEDKEDKEPKYSFKKMGWGFLSRGRKVEKENQEEQEESKDSITLPPFEQEQKKEEKEKTTSGFGLRRLMGLTTRKAPPPALSLSISSPAALLPKSPTTFTQAEEKMQQRNTKRSTSPPVSPRKAISGPYVLGSHLPSRSPPTHSAISPPSSSSLHQQISSRPIPTSSSNTSLNKMHGGRQYGHHNSQTLSATSQEGGSHHRARSLRSTHRTNASLTTVTHLGMKTERPVGPKVAGARPKGLVIGADSMLSVNAVPVPLKNAPSYESFRSAQSYGGRSDVGSMRSGKSVGAGSMRSFRTWMNKAGTGVGGGRSVTGVTVAVAE